MQKMENIFCPTICRYLFWWYTGLHRIDWAVVWYIYIYKHKGLVQFTRGLFIIPIGELYVYFSPCSAHITFKLLDKEVYSWNRSQNKGMFSSQVAESRVLENHRTHTTSKVLINMQCNTVHCTMTGLW